MSKPLIGITGRRYQLGLVAGADRRYGGMWTDSFMSAFATRIARAGGVPVHLPYDAAAEDVVAWLSGVVISGGQDVHPARWGGDPAVVREVDPRTDTAVHDAERDAYEIGLVHQALEHDLPVLGVCRGLQVINVALGGTLVPDLPSGPVQHLSPECAPTDGTPDHTVSFEPGSIVARLFGDRAVTNSWHHQAVDRRGEGLVVTGRTSDGVVEAVELSGESLLAVQWHPEWMAGPDPTLEWLVAEAAERLRSRAADIR